MRIKKLTEVPKIHLTNGECRINGISRPGIGLLVDEYFEPLLEPSFFLVSSAVVKNDKPSSVIEYGRTLRMYWEFLSAEKINWLSVNDNVLVKFRDMMESGQRVSKRQKSRLHVFGEDFSVDPATINNRLSVIFAFYKWAMENNFAPRNIIGLAGESLSYSITAHKSDKGHWYWPYLLKNPARPPPNIPTKDDIDNLHDIFDKLFEQDHASRSRLIASWMENTGMRGIEVASIKVSLIPEYEEIDALIAQEKLYELDFSPKRKGVKTKGGKSRKIDIDPILLEFTKDYIEGERKIIVERAQALAKKKGFIYNEPDEIFLNLIDGSPLSKKSIQNEFSKVCRENDLNLKSHGLRKYYAMKVTTDLYFSALRKVNGDVRKVDINTIILFVQQKLGHSHASTTIASYINIVKLKFLAMSVESRAILLASRKDIVERQLSSLQMRLREVESKLELSNELKNAVACNNKDEAMQLLKNIFA